MRTHSQDLNGASGIADGLWRAGRLAVRGVLQALRFALYGVLVLIRPLLIPILTGVAIGGVVIWAVFVLIAHDSGFPSLHVLGLALGCAVLTVLYYAVMESLVPESQNPNR